MSSATSLSVGFRPFETSKFNLCLPIRERASYTCTGSRMVRHWSFTAREHACLIHQCTYVESLNPRVGSNFSIPRISPVIPSWMRSSKATPLPMYRFATLTTNRKLCSTRSCFDRRDVNRSNSNSLMSIAKSSHSSASVGSRPSASRKNSHARAILECSCTCVVSITSSSLLSNFALPNSIRKE